MDQNHKLKPDMLYHIMAILLPIGIACYIGLAIHDFSKVAEQMQTQEVSSEQEENAEEVEDIEDVSDAKDKGIDTDAVNMEEVEGLEKRAEAVPVFEDRIEYLDYFRKLHPQMDSLQAFPQDDETGSDVDTGDIIWIVHENEQNDYYFIQNGLNWVYTEKDDTEDSYMKEIFNETNHTQYDEIFSWQADGNLMIKDYSQKHYYMEQDIGNHERMIFDCRATEESQEEGGVKYKITVTHAGDKEPFQVLETYSLREDSFFFEDFNADGYLDLTVIFCYGANGGTAYHYVWCPSQNCFQKTSEELEDYGWYNIDPDTRTLYIHYHYSAGEGEESAFQWSGETDYRMVKHFKHEMYEGEIDQFYLDVNIERYDENGTTIISDYDYPVKENEEDEQEQTNDIWAMFYSDFTWEKQVRDHTTNASYMLRYAEEAIRDEAETTQPVTNETETTQKYKGRLFVFNEDTSMIKCLKTEGTVLYKTITWSDTDQDGLYELVIEFEDGSQKSYTEDELFGCD